jgi:hypothetical protein
VTPVGWLLTPVMAAICRGESIVQLKNKMSRMMFFNNWIGFFNETYLFLGVCAALNTFYLRFNTAGNAFNSIVTIVFGLAILVFPFFVAIFYNIPKFYKRIIEKDEEFLQRFG